MGSEFLPYVAIIITIVVAVGIALAILVLNAVLGPKRPSEAKMGPFECGSDVVDTPRKRINVRFYAVAIFFVVFDIEALFLIPIAVAYRDLLQPQHLGVFALFALLLFIGVLAIGLWYVWGKGALDWAFDALTSSAARSDANE
ncbi:MAG: NADH-quinone oxidoreductase subunit A [Myxococcota bacterium]|jgi:NADH-quinone oxidoreductase subunit A|nr:NADH-quinone oxidoreductase subunit A [Myxococcota bacterium]OQC41280.1 MAG: NADH-quinone oxidoreductase subunit 7 [Deltaproteobacteria bacterium ADurb.Bin058]HHW95720.1 NADH-quinone oxidoreductase subunit A [Oligoflexales bacterium]MBP8970182.1 NADH-quinone oxidoreductase subunit A [Myxococcota bacterium]HOE82637.1 NADH-quinone oxidoreductase subunit A [Myxococcota bacterium]